MPLAEWSPAAIDELTNIVLYIAEIEGKRETAFRIYDEIRDKCDEYARAFQSGNIIGTERPEFGEGYRTFSLKRWVVLFRTAADGVYVVHIFDGARDYPRLFGSFD